MGAGALNLGGTAASVTNLTLAGGTVNNGTLTVAGSIAAQSGSAGALLTGPAGLLKTTSGTVILTNANNSYTGGTTVSQGVLRSGRPGNSPAANSPAAARSSSAAAPCRSTPWWPD